MTTHSANGFRWLGGCAAFLIAAAGAHAQWVPIVQTSADAPAPMAPEKLPAPTVTQAPVETIVESAPPAASPYAGPLFERTKLTGDWGGARSALAECGITFDISTGQYYQGITSGGLQETFRYGGRNDYFMTVDGQKAGLWQGFFINLHGETLYGDSVNNFTGALMPVNTGMLFPKPNQSVTALTGVKFTQALSENFLVFAGKLNMFDDFAQPFLPGMGLNIGFMNLAAIINPVIGRTVPYSTLGGGAAVLVEGKPIATIMVIDTNNTPTTTGFESFFDNGASIIGMATLPTNFFGRAGHHTLLGTYSTGTYASTDFTPFTLVSRLVQGLPGITRVNDSWSLLYMFDQTLWTDPCDPKRSWGLFGSFGFADHSNNPIGWAATIGVAGSSPLANRKLDTFGVCCYYLGLTDGFKNIAPVLLPLRDEQGIELFYNAAVTPWCHLTPDLQVILPSRSRNDAVTALGMRAKIDF